MMFSRWSETTGLLQVAKYELLTVINCNCGDCVVDTK